MASVVAVAVGGVNMSDLQQAFERHLVRSRFFATRDNVVVAVSTGVDSMVLLDLLQHLPLKYRPQIIVAHMNHELRKQSQLEEQFIRQYCEQKALKLEVAHWSQTLHPPTGVENAARQARYQFFQKVMEDNQARILLTAHHQNDLAETMLMKLTRGGQVSQLVGIRDQRPFTNGTLIRPLLPFSKQQLMEYALQHHLRWYEDQTNKDLDIQRNRFRHRIIPMLEKENAQLLAHLENYHQQLTELLAWRDQEIADRLAECIDRQGRMILAKLSDNKEFIQKEVLRQWLNHQGVYDIKNHQLDELLQVLTNEKKPQQTIKLPHQYILEKDYATCALKKLENPLENLQKPQDHVIKLEQWYQVDSISLMAVSAQESFFKGEEQVVFQWLDPDQFPLVLRKWRQKDRIRLKNGHHQLVKRVLIDQKVPQKQRDQQMVLVDAHDEVVWIVNRKWSWFERPTDYRQTWQPCFIGIKNKEKKVNE
ncbi:tRNA lysidine(34) synthetase TilS [Limosilactobacillus agrestis]|nr:tRNA lysidine(34) synthetase TilS [Limosilactobacillus agrestis]